MTTKPHLGQARREKKHYSNVPMDMAGSLLYNAAVALSQEAGITVEEEAELHPSLKEKILNYKKYLEVHK